MGLWGKMVKKKRIVIESHSLMPKHSVCSDKEKKSVLTQYHATLEQFPKVLISDAGIATLKAKIGDMIKIERNDATMGKVVFYRVVSDE